MFGVEVSAVERYLLMLSLWFGGLGFSDPLTLASHLFASPVRATEHLLLVLKFLNWILILIMFLSKKQFHHQQLGATFDEEFDQLLTLFDPMQQGANLWAKDSNISSWLSVLPLARSQFDL